MKSASEDSRERERLVKSLSLKPKTTTKCSVAELSLNPLLRFFLSQRLIAMSDAEQKEMQW